MDARIGLLCLMACGSVALCADAALQSEFVKKKKKEPSIAMLKEECCRVSADILSEIPSMLTAIADVQVACLITVNDVIDADKDSFCEQASKKELQAYLESLEKTHTALINIQTELVKNISHLRACVSGKKAHS